MITPRWYQAEAIEKGAEFLRKSKGQNGLIMLPTGSGKSVVLAGLAKELAEPTLILQPSKEILAQNVAKYRSFGFGCGIYSASAGVKNMRDVTFAMVGSIHKKQHMLERFRYVLIDECHLCNAKEGMLQDVISTMGVPVLGLTATPYRLGREVDERGETRSILKFLTRTRPRVFDRVVYYVQNRELFDAGFLARMQYFEIGGFSRQNLQTNSTGADYTDQSVREAMRASSFHVKLVQVVNRLFTIGRKNCIVFTRFTEEARALVQAVPGSAIVTAETPPKERDRIIEGFRAGRIRCVANVGILTTGFDYPELEAVVVARPTRSLALWYQMIGRGMRPSPNKDHTMVVDMCGNLAQFGKAEDMELSDEGGWHIRSNGRPLTNVPFGAAIRLPHR